MSKPALDDNGLRYLWSKIKTLFVAKEAGKGLSTNDFTNEYKAKLDNAKTTIAWEDVIDKPDFTSVMNYKGSVQTKNDLPNDAKQGDTYNVVSEGGMNYSWTGTEWDPSGSVFELTTITNAEIDEITGS